MNIVLFNRKVYSIHHYDQILKTFETGKYTGEPEVWLR